MLAKPIMCAKRVGITGIGLLTCLGSGKGAIFSSLLGKKSGIQQLIGDEWCNMTCTVAGLISPDFDINKEFSTAERREKSKPILYALYAARKAIQDSGLDQNVNPETFGVSVGIGMPDLSEIYEAGLKLSDKGLRALSPYFIPRSLVNMAAGHISIEHNCQGPNLTLSTACTTGLHCVGEGFRLIQSGQADIMICGGSEAPISTIGVAGFTRMRALCTDFNEEPEKASRPFDKRRSGFVMSEGSAMLILEDIDRARSRGAKIYAEIIGYGLSGDAHHMSAPRQDGHGALRSMKAALKDASLTPSDVTYINAHATSTLLGDQAEANACSQLFSENQQKVLISSNKGNFGHLLGAAGSLEAAITALSISEKKIPPTANLSEPDVTGNFELVREAQDWTTPSRIALTNSFGFGGTNASLCLRDYAE